MRGLMTPAGLARLAPALTLCMALAAAGCVRPPIAAQTYDQAVAELGQPLSCDDKGDGGRYCSWPDTGGLPAVEVERVLVMQFDRDGRLVKRYHQNYLRR